MDDSSLEAQPMLTEDDFNDFAAVVGEGADGSDDDSRVSRGRHILHVFPTPPMTGVVQ